MLNADSKKSFDVAARHLFRHLSNAKALRGNPIVRSALRRHNAESETDLAVLAAIRGWILNASALCFAADIAAGFKLRAERQRSIVASLLSGVPIAETAVTLGISTPQAYRDRRAICQKVVRMLATGRVGSHRSEVVDPWKAAITRASLLVDHGYGTKAVTELERILSNVASTTAKLRTELVLCGALIELGNLKSAETFLKSGKRLLRDCSQASGGVDSIRTFATLTELRLSMAMGRFGDASNSIKTLLSRPEAILYLPEELRLAVYLEAAFFYGHIGNFVEVERLVKRAKQLKNRTDRVSSGIGAQISFMKAYSLEGQPIGSMERLLEYEEALSLSINAGSARFTLLTILGLANHWADLGDDARAALYADQALLVAGSIDGTKNLVTACVDAAFALIKTRRWRSANRLLRQASKFATPRTLDWSVLKALQGSFLTRSRDYSEAIAALNIAETSARKLRNDSHTAAVLRDLATAYRLAGRLVRAKDCIREAVSLADRGTSGSGFYWTQKTASQILAG